MSLLKIIVTFFLLLLVSNWAKLLFWSLNCLDESGKNEGMASLEYKAHLCSIVAHNYRDLRVSASLPTERGIAESKSWLAFSSPSLYLAFS